MQLDFMAFIIVCPLVFLAGFIDAIAGGGGMISLPAYLLAGVPIHSALGTNKLSSSIGTVVSTIRYGKKGYVKWVYALPGIVFALGGSFLGSNLALLVEDRILKIMLLVILPVVLFYILKNREFRPRKNANLSKGLTMALSCLFSFLVGGYDGFYGPGAGMFILILFTAGIGFDVKTASGNAKVMNLSSNIAALVTFIANGKVVFSLGLVAAIFSVLGHYVGAGMVLKNGSKIVRPIIMVVIVLLYIKIIYEL